MVEETTRITQLRVLKSPVMVYQHLPQGGQELILNQEYVSLKALDGFFLHRSLISKSFAHLYLSSAISDLNRWILFFRLFYLTVVEHPR